MKWLLRLTLIFLALDLAAGVFGFSIAFRTGAASSAGFWTPVTIGFTALLLACAAVWAWAFVQSLRAPAAAVKPFAAYLGLRFGLGALILLQLGESELGQALAMNLAPLLAAPVVLLLLWKPPAGEGGSEGPREP